MAVMSKHHKELDADGVGRCSVPMWCGGLPAGFCDKPAYGKRPPSKSWVDAYGERRREDRRYAGYVPGLACPGHGGPPAVGPQRKRARGQSGPEGTTDAE